MMKKRMLHILLIEKDPILSGLLEYWIGSDHHTVVSVSSEFNAYLKASALYFDAIILDVDLLGSSPATLIVNLHAMQPRASIFVIVPFGKEDIAIQVLREGADYALSKPIKIDYLRKCLSATMKRALDKRINA